MRKKRNSDCNNDDSMDENLKTFIKVVQIGDTWKEVECAYEIINNCAIEKGGDYLVHIKEGAAIPDYVKTIGRGAFFMSNVQEIVFPNSVEVIESRGCADCYSLESVTLNDGLKKIGKMAFRIPSTVEEIEGGAFGDIKLIVDSRNPKYEIRGNCLIEKDTKKVINVGQDAVIPEDVKIISSFAFFDSKIEQIEIPRNVEKIEEDAFLNCGLKTIKLSEGLREIGDNAFFATKLKRITIPSSVDYIGMQAFEEIEFSIVEGNKKYEVRENCIIEKETKKTIIAGKDAKISDDIKHIGDRAFCSRNIGHLKLLKNINSIGEFAFCDASKIKKVILDEGLKAIGFGAFSGVKIKSIVIPSSVEVIGRYVFGCCDKLKKIYCRAKSKPDGWDDMWNSEGSEDVWFDVVWGYTGK